jgi:hypothetical protein
VTPNCRVRPAGSAVPITPRRDRQCSTRPRPDRREVPGNDFLAFDRCRSVLPCGAACHLEHHHQPWRRNRTSKWQKRFRWIDARAQQQPERASGYHDRCSQGARNRTSTTIHPRMPAAPLHKPDRLAAMDSRGGVPCAAPARFAREGAFFCSLFPCPVARPPTPPPRARPVGSVVELPAPQQYSPWARD